VRISDRLGGVAMKGAQIDIEQRDELHDDIYDRMLIEQRKNESSVPWSDVKRELMTLGKHDES
jgi:hypothetical protein